LVLAAMFALCVGSLAAAMVYNAVSEQINQVRGSAVNPWRYDRGKRNDMFAEWSYPPLVEATRMVMRSMKSDAEKLIENRTSLNQARLLINIRKLRDKEFQVKKRTPGPAGFRWEVELDEDHQAMIMKRAKTKLLGISRALAHIERHIDHHTNLLLEKIEWAQAVLIVRVRTLLVKGFPRHTFSWPEAAVSKEGIEQAMFSIEEENKKSRHRAVQISSKRAQVLNKQVALAHQLTAEVLQALVQADQDNLPQAARELRHAVHAAFPDDPSLRPKTVQKVQEAAPVKGADLHLDHEEDA